MYECKKTKQNLQYQVQQKVFMQFFSNIEKLHMLLLYECFFCSAAAGAHFKLLYMLSDSGRSSQQLLKCKIPPCSAAYATWLPP